MNSAYVLVTVENAKVAGKDPTKKFIADVKRLGYVREATEVTGAYDALLKIEYGPNGDLSARMGEIKDMKYVKATYTLIDASNTAHMNDDIPYRDRKNPQDSV